MLENDQEYEFSQAFCQIYASIRSLQKSYAGECDRNIVALHRCKEEIEAMIHSNETLRLGLSFFPCRSDHPDGASLFVFDRYED